MATESVSELVLAEEVVVRQLPNPAERGLVRERLLASATAAERFAPNAWGATLFRNGFRLNVGQVEAVVFIDGQLKLLLVGLAGSAPLIGPNFVGTSYASVPQPQCAFLGTVKQYVAQQSILSSRHEEFVRLAAHAPSGKPRRGSPFRRTHTEGLIQYAAAQFGHGRAA